MAAQERAKQAKKTSATTTTTTEESHDALLLQLDDEDEDHQSSQPPPPAFDASTLPPSNETLLPPPMFGEVDLPPPPQAAMEIMNSPPPFDLVENSVMEQVKAPPAAAAAAPTFAAMPSAPALEDLLDYHPSSTQQQQQQQYSPFMEGMELMKPPAQSQPPPQEVEEEDNAFLAGLSEEERRELLEEQRKILEQIEREKVVVGDLAANAAADAFDQRSAPAVARIASELDPTPTTTTSTKTRSIRLGNTGPSVALHGPERTRAAIDNGTAMLVQCLSCNNWMQVTPTATLMLCPVCQVVSPVDRQTAVFTKEEAMQMEADRQMAEQLQQEEYQHAEEQEAAAAAAAAAKAKANKSPDSSWWEWLGLSTSTTTPTTGASSSAPATGRLVVPPPQAPVQRGEMGVSRPPTMFSASTTGHNSEEISFSRSYEEEDGLLLHNSMDQTPPRYSPSSSRPNNSNGNMMLAARVAPQKPLFSCVADSITSAASAMSTALTTTSLTQDDEGNVHGVDATSLLAVTTAGRQESWYYSDAPSYHVVREDEH
jgi:hypothetical protein